MLFFIWFFLNLKVGILGISMASRTEMDEVLPPAGACVIEANFRMYQLQKQHTF